MNRTCLRRQALVFDLGGTHLRCGLWDEAGTIRSMRRTRVRNFLGQTCVSSVWESLLAQICNYCRTAAPFTSPDAPIVISFPGPIEHKRRILSAPTLLGCDREIPDLVGNIEELTGRRVYILNDLSAAAWHLSATIEVDRFMVVTVSSGIGSKIFDRTSSSGVIDTPAWAGEIGHVVVDHGPQAPRCDCGGRGHLGAIASGRGVERAARRRAGEYPSEFAKSVCATLLEGTQSELNNEDHVVPGTLAGDPWCLEVVREAAKPLARVILSVAVAAGIERVVLIGGFALSLGAVYFNILREELLFACDYSVVNRQLASLVEMGSNCEEACLMGAGAFANRFLGESR